MQEYIAKTLQGLEGVLADELKALGAKDIEIQRRAVSFKGDKKCLLCKIYSTVATTMQ